MSFGDSLIVTVVSMAVVFAVLVVIAFLISIMQNLLGGKQQEAPSGAVVTAPEIEEVPEEDFGEIVAVIMAAIQAAEGNASGFKVNTIKRLNDARDAWKNAGIKEQINK